MDILFLWTRRLGVVIAIIGAWETFGWSLAWLDGFQSDLGDLVFWSASCVIGIAIYLRLRNIEARPDPSHPLQDASKSS